VCDMCVCVYVSMSEYMYVYMCVCECVSICMLYVCVCVCVVSMYVCENERICQHWRVQISSIDGLIDCCGALIHSTSM
jgi:hypothetical protein